MLDIENELDQLRRDELRNLENRFRRSLRASLMKSKEKRDVKKKLEKKLLKKKVKKKRISIFPKEREINERIKRDILRKEKIREYKLRKEREINERIKKERLIREKIFKDVVRGINLRSLKEIEISVEKRHGKIFKKI